MFVCVFVYGPKGGDLLGNAKLHSSGQTYTDTQTHSTNRAGQDVTCLFAYISHSGDV